MKKAYVKPVFIADTYELTSSVAGCGPVSVYSGWRINANMQICTEKHGNQQSAHSIKQSSLDKTYIGNDDGANLSYWEYATYTGKDDQGNYQFNNDDAYIFFNNVICDFLWNPEDQEGGRGDVYVWDSIEKNGGIKLVGSLFSWLTGSNASHPVGNAEGQKPFS